MLSIFTSKWLPWGLLVLGGGIVWFLLTAEHTKQLSIKNPDVKKAEVVERVITKTVDSKGEAVVVITEKISTTLESNSKISKDFGKYYLSGNYGICINDAERKTWGVGAGYNITSALSLGLCYDTIGPEHRIAVEMRVNF